MLAQALDHLGFDKLLNPTPNCIWVHTHEPRRPSHRDAELAGFPIGNQEDVHGD
jgi:hypothetical protein